MKTRRYFYLMSVLQTGLMAMLLLSPSWGMAQGTDPDTVDEDEDISADQPVQVAGSFFVSRLEGVLRSIESIPEDLQDTAFDHYVDVALLGDAWDSKDPQLLTDVALQLAEGERILLRSHKAISAEKLLQLAVRAATEKKDTTALERLQKVAQKTENKDLATQVAAATKLAAQSRGGDPMTTVPVEEMDAETYAAYRHLLTRLQDAKISATASDLDAIEEQVKQIERLSDQRRDNLLKLAAAVRTEIPADAKPDAGIAALDRLADVSRGWNLHNMRSLSSRISHNMKPPSSSLMQRPSQSRPGSSSGRTISQTGSLAINPNFGHGSILLTPGGRAYRITGSNNIGPTGTLAIHQNR